MVSFFFFNDTATTEIYTLSLHDALPIYGRVDNVERLRFSSTGRSVYFNEDGSVKRPGQRVTNPDMAQTLRRIDRKSTRLNSSHANISYAVFCLKKKR